MAQDCNKTIVLNSIEKIGIDSAFVEKTVQRSDQKPIFKERPRAKKSDVKMSNSKVAENFPSSSMPYPKRWIIVDNL